MTRVTIHPPTHSPGRARWQSPRAGRKGASIGDHGNGVQSILRVCRIWLGSRVSGTSFRNSTAGVVN